jgi:drug/metabolite transporter (DMT)-like permease
MSGSGEGRESNSAAYFLLLILVNLMWAFQYTGARIATQKLGPIAVALLPMAMSTVPLTVLLLLERRKKGSENTGERGSFGRRLLNFVILAMVGSFMAQLGLTSGVQRSLASNAAVLTLTIPVLTALLATVLVGEKMSRLLWISFGLAIVGVLTVSDVDWRTVDIFHGKYLVGNALIIAGCCGSAFYNAYSKRLLRVFTPLEVLVYTFMIGDVALFTLMMARERVTWQYLASLGAAVWLSLVCIAVFTLTLAMTLFFWVIKRINLTQAALSFYLLPVFGVLISTVTLKEKMRWQLLIGGVLVFIGTFLATTYGRRKQTKEVRSE